ncbi:MAG: class I SAM-dependent methyltransferase [Candidatus Gracilibacteria bacterium]
MRYIGKTSQTQQRQLALGNSWLKKHLPIHAKVLQVGCMDGTRILELLKVRPDLKVTGLDCEAPFLTIARQKIKKSGFKNVQFILGDITKPHFHLNHKFDAVLCLNNTLGYIEKDEKAIQNMKKMGRRVILSMYGEKFTDPLAKKYLKTIHLTVTRIQNHRFYTKENVFIRRFTKFEISLWGGMVFSTPIGYISDIMLPIKKPKKCQF